MLIQLGRRLIVAVIVLVGVAVVTFTLSYIVSPSPAHVLLGETATPEAIAAFNRENGYDQPFVVQLFAYLGRLTQGDLGYSYKLSQSVGDLFLQNAGRSAYLSGAALTLAILISIPLGIFQAVKRKSPADYAVTTLTFVLYSMPSFFLGMILIQVFALNLGWLPYQASQATTVWGVIADVPSMILPIATLTALQIAGYSRYMRSAALDNIAQDYIRLARAKGLSQKQVLFGHLVRNSCLPLVTLIGLSIPTLLGGSIIIESLFNYPGLGLLFFHSLQNEDFPVLLALTFIGGVLVIIGNIVADMASTIADPRIRL